MEIVKKFHSGTFPLKECGYIRKNWPTLPALPHKRIKRGESLDLSRPQLVAVGSTRGGGGVYNAFFTPRSERHT